MLNDVTVFNIREYLSSDDKILGEEQLQKVLSEFLCSKNTDVGYNKVTVYNSQFYLIDYFFGMKNNSFFVTVQIGSFL